MFHRREKKRMNIVKINCEEKCLHPLVQELELGVMFMLSGQKVENNTVPEICKCHVVRVIELDRLG